MDRIIRAEAVAMRVTLASLLADMRGPAGPPRRGNYDAPARRLPSAARRSSEAGRDAQPGAEDVAEMTDEIAEDEPFAPFARWFELAMRSEPLAEAMMLATATRDGVPSVRAVLLKGADASGFVFYTNLESRKAEELTANPRAALCFHWKSLGRQVRIEGAVAPVAAAEADAYFASRRARQPDRRLGLGAVAAARKPRRAGRALRRVRATNTPEQARRAAAGELVRLSRARRNGSSSGRSGRSGCMTGSSSSARARRWRKRRLFP